jgi:hypothetical protein
MQYQLATSPFAGPGRQGMMRNGGTIGQNVAGTRMGGGGPVSGEIISVDENSITVKMEDASSKIVLLSKDTLINKSSVGSLENLIKGENVMVIGKTNSDGSVSAQTISIGGRMMQREPFDEK